MWRSSRKALYPTLLIAMGLGGIGCAPPETTGPKLVKSAGSSADEYAGDEAGDEATAAGEGGSVLTPEKGDGIEPSSNTQNSAAKPCAVNDLALCLTFEGSSVDQSTAPIQAAEASGLDYVPGKQGQGARFGSQSALRFGPNIVFDLPAGAATIEAWIKRASSTEDAVVFDDDARFSLTINAAGQVWCKSSGGAITGARVVPVEQWAHVACVIEGGTMRAYVDGALDASGPGAVVSSPSSPAAVGGNAPSGEPFVGVIDSLRVFRVARSPADIALAAKP